MEKKNLFKGLSIGIALGILFSLLEIIVWLSQYTVFLIDLVTLLFLAITGLVTFRFIKTPESGILCGITIVLSKALSISVYIFIVSKNWSNPFFYLTSSLNWPGLLAINPLLGFFLRIIGFPIAGFLGGYAVKKPTFKSPTISLPMEKKLSNEREVKPSINLERKVLEYVESHQYKIRISECAEDVNNVMKSLEERGLLKRKNF